MKDFIIGHHGHFSKDKQLRDYRENFWGVEACLIESDADIQKLHELKKSGEINIGIHFPLKSGQWGHRDPQYLSNCSQIREESYTYMLNDINRAVEIEPEYILLHYPKPVILDERVDWHGWKWKFAHESEYCYEKEYDYETFLSRSKEFFKWFSEMAYKNNFIPILELDTIPRYLYETDMLTDLLKTYPNIKLCADIGRLHIQDMIDENFDSFKFLENIVDYIDEVHLWNIQVQKGLYNSHFPALSMLDPKDGWADVEKYFKLLNKNNNKFKVLFEHRSDLISDEELDDCYDWIKSMT